DVTGTLEARTRGGGFPGTDFALAGGVIAASLETVPTPDRLRAEQGHIVYRQQRTTDYVEDRIASTVAARDYKDATDLIAFNARQDPVSEIELAGTLDGGHPVGAVLTDTLRKFTPLECQRLQGFPPVMIVDMDISRDELAATALAARHLITDLDTGKVFRTRGPGGMILNEPKEWGTSNVNGYRAGTLRVGEVRRQVRTHRVVWIAANGVPPHGASVCHRNNIKHDNRLSNLYLATPEQNSSDAKRDGLYRGNNDSRRKLSQDDYTLIIRDYAEGERTQQSLADEYGVSQSRVSQIVRMDDFYDGITMSDTQKYRQMGNAVAVPVAEWIMRRIAAS
ncbi:hypothetical protein LCGC14_2767820, partial [marine sediment metagenome]